MNDLVNTEAYERYSQKPSEFRSGRKSIQVLLYNEKAGKAYFVVVDAPL